MQTVTETLATADRALYAERCRVVDLEQRLAASEERARRLEEALREIREWAGGLGWLGSPQDERVEAEVLAIVNLLAPPPEAEKKGGEKP